MKGKENRADALQREEMASGICKIMTKRKLERTSKFIAEHTATLSIGNSETADSMGYTKIPVFLHGHICHSWRLALSMSTK